MNGKKINCRLRHENLSVNNVFLNIDNEGNTEYTFSFWSSKVDMPGPQRAAQPLSRHIVVAAESVGRSKEHYYRKVPKLVFEISTIF